MEEGERHTEEPRHEQVVRNEEKSHPNRQVVSGFFCRIAGHRVIGTTGTEATKEGFARSSTTAQHNSLVMRVFRRACRQPISISQPTRTQARAHDEV